MSNVFIRTNIAPYRVDTYNAFQEQLDMLMCFYYRFGEDQKFDVDYIESLCSFKPVYLKGIKFGGHNRKWCFGLFRILHIEKPKIVIVPEFQISAFQVLLYRWFTRSKFKIVSMTDDSYDMISNNNDFTRLHAWLRNHLAKFFDEFIVVTPQVEQWYQQRYHKGIWLPIIMNEKTVVANYERLLPLSREYLIKYKLEHKKILLYVGRLVELKNLHRLLTAFEQVKTEATLIIVGDGPERISLEEHAKSINKEILFMGRYDGDKLYAWYNLACVFILASYQEAFGAVTNEALLSGCRVVISEKAGSSCLVNSTNGEIIDPMNEQAIASAIDRQLSFTQIPLLTSPRPSLMTVSFEERITHLVDNLIRN